MAELPEPRPRPDDDAAIRAAVQAAHEEDERLVLRVRERYNPRWRAGRHALEEAARAIREQG